MYSVILGRNLHSYTARRSSQIHAVDNIWSISHPNPPVEGEVHGCDDDLL